MADSVSTMKVKVSFDDGRTLDVPVRQRDIARLEELDPQFAKDGQITPRRVYLLAWGAVSRMSRQGLLPEGFKLPATLDDFLDMADVEGEADPEGKA